MTKAHYEGTKNKRSIVGEQYYEEFSTEFWKEPLHANVRKGPLRNTSSSNTPSRSQPSSRIPRPTPSSATTSKIPRAIPSPNRSCPTTPAISRSPSSGSRPVTFSFSQSAKTINIFINYNDLDHQE
ncbi:hypothetical protein RclHR1_09730005 [Rhizophagus clarus]|nr:hypothetical protein RclHR1_09730005 [Rhizophagus clarus]